MYNVYYTYKLSSLTLDNNSRIMDLFTLHTDYRCLWFKGNRCKFPPLICRFISYAMSHDVNHGDYKENYKDINSIKTGFIETQNS